MTNLTGADRNALRDISEEYGVVGAALEHVEALEAEVERLHLWVEAESGGATLPPNAVDAAIEIANERGKQVERLAVLLAAKDP